MSTPAQSANQTVINDPSSAPIVDSGGNPWRISRNGLVQCGNDYDPDPSPVLQLAYVNGRVWRQTHDLRWHSKGHRNDPWLPAGGTTTSPLSGATAQQFSSVLVAIAEVLESITALQSALSSQGSQSLTPVLTAIAALRADFDTFAAQGSPSLSPVLQAVTALKADLDSRENAATTLAINNQTILHDMLGLIIQMLPAMAARATDFQSALITRLDDILAIIKDLQSPQPTEIALDFDHATHTPQPIPIKPGP